MTRSLFLALALALTLLGVRDAAGQSAWKLSYQGVLTDDSGTLVPDGSYKLDFRLYADSIGGSARNYQSQMVPVARGVFTVLLDRPADLPFDQQWWLSVAVSGSAELAPRTRLSAAPYALRADTSSHVPVGAIGTENIAAKAVGSAQLKDSLTVNRLYVLETGGGRAFDVATSNAGSIAAAVFNTTADGTGLVAGGTLGGVPYPSSGAGIAAAGGGFGVYASSVLSGGAANAGGYFRDAQNDYAYVAYHDGTGTNYKIYGTGAVSSIMTTTGGRVGLIAPESPEAWIQDLGSGQMTGGHAVVTLDNRFLQCVTLADPTQMRVFVQFTSPPPASYYVTKNAAGFEVVDGSGAPTTASFDWIVMGRWKGWESVRFAPAPGPAEAQSVAPNDAASPRGR